jgi:hypothetical protein
VCVIRLFQRLADIDHPLRHTRIRERGKFEGLCSLARLAMTKIEFEAVTAVFFTFFSFCASADVSIADG